MGRQIAGASAPSCSPGLCPCPCCINYPSASFSSATSELLQQDDPITRNPELEALNNDTTTLLNRLRSHVLPNPASSSSASDIRISTSISASRADQRPITSSINDAPFPSNMLPPRLGTPVPTSRATQSDTSLGSLPDTLPPLPSSSSFHDRSVSTAIRARLEELDEQIARTMLRSERNRNRASENSSSASMDRVNTAIENSRSGLSQARDAIRNALQHSERLERIAGVLRRSMYSPDGSMVLPPGSDAPLSIAPPSSGSMGPLARNNRINSTTARGTGRLPDAPSTVDGEHAGIQTNLDRSLADLRAASREIDRVISLAARERSPSSGRSTGTAPIDSSSPPTPEPPVRQMSLSRRPLPSRARPEAHSDPPTTTPSAPRRPSRTRWLSGDSAGIPLSTQQTSSASSQSDSSPVFDSLRSASSSAAASTSTLSQASAELRSSTVALARRVLANSRATRATSTADQAVRETSTADQVEAGPTSSPSTATGSVPSYFRDLRARLPPGPSDGGPDPYAALTLASSRRERVEASRALERALGIQTPASQQSSSSVYNPPSVLREASPSAVAVIRQTSSTRPITGFRIRPEMVGALSDLTRESDDEESTSRSPAATARPSRRNAAPANRRDPTSPPNLAAIPVVNSATPLTAEELALLGTDDSEDPEDGSDEMMEEEDEYLPSIRRPLFRPISRNNELESNGRLTYSPPRITIGGGWRQVDANGDVIQPNGGDQSLAQTAGEGISRGNGRGWYWTPPTVAGIMNDEGEEKITLSNEDDRDGDTSLGPSSGQATEGRVVTYRSDREMVGR